MTNKNRRVLKVAGIILCVVLLCAFFCYQVFMIAYSPVKTEIALASKISKTVDTMIYAVREETELNGSYSGYVVPLVENGERVASGDAVIAVFSGEEAAQAYTSYTQLLDEIDYYNRLSASTVSQYSDFDKLTADADQSIYRYVAAVYGGDLQSAGETALDVRSSITARRNASGETVDYSQIISTLTAQSQSLVASAGQYASVISEQSGYYISTCDGYENMVSYQDVASMGVAEIEKALSLQPREVSVDSVGKLVRYFDWYFVCNIDVSFMSEIQVGDKKLVSLPYSTADDFEAEVYRINDTVDGKTAVVFKVNAMNADLASLRQEYASIQLESYSGYRIPNTAIRTVDGQKGVYILRNNLVSFKKIDIIYTSGEYTLVGNLEGGSGYIRLYDEVITEGTDLYDGKLIR